MNIPEWSTFFKGDRAFEIYKSVFDQLTIWDAHAHMGFDKDGSRSTISQLIGQMNRSGVEKAIIFPLNDPRRQKNFEISNNEIYDAYKKYPGRFIPFFRLDPNQPWKEEFEQRISQKFRGLKLHPRSQNFNLQNENVLQILEQTQKRRIPVLIHTGLGMDDVTSPVVRLAKEFPNLKIILGHAAFVDIENAIRKLSAFRNVYFETSVARIFDLHDILRSVPDERILFGSDFPYRDIEYSVESMIHSSVILDISLSKMEKIFSKNLMNLIR